jgi:hypothetical protein
MSISSDDENDSTESDAEFDSEHDSDVDMRMEDDLDAPDSVDLEGDVDMERDTDDEEDEEEENEQEEDKMEEVVVDEDEEEDEDNGKEPRMTGQGEMVNTSVDNADTMVNAEPTVVPDQGQNMGKHNPRPQPLASAPRPRTLETHTLGGLEFLELMTPQKPRQVAPTLRAAEAAGTPRMSMWSSSYSANRQVATVSPISLSLMSLSPMSLSLRHGGMAW